MVEALEGMEVMEGWIVRLCQVKGEGREVERGGVVEALEGVEVVGNGLEVGVW